MTSTIPTVRLLALPYPTLLVKEEEAGAGEGGEDAEFPPAEVGERLVSEVHGHVDVEEELVGPLLPQPRHQRLPRPRLLLHMLLMASPSKGRRQLILLRLPRGPAQWLLELGTRLCLDIIISAILLLDMTALPITRLHSRVQRIVQLDPILKVLRFDSAVSNRRLLHDRLFQQFNVHIRRRSFFPEYESDFLIS